MICRLQSPTHGKSTEVLELRVTGREERMRTSVFVRPYPVLLSKVFGRLVPNSYGRDGRAKPPKDVSPWKSYVWAELGMSLPRASLLLGCPQTFECLERALQGEQSRPHVVLWGILQSRALAKCRECCFVKKPGRRDPSHPQEWPQVFLC